MKQSNPTHTNVQCVALRSANHGGNLHIHGRLDAQLGLSDAWCATKFSHFATGDATVAEPSVADVALVWRHVTLIHDGWWWWYRGCHPGGEETVKAGAKRRDGRHGGFAL